MAEGEGRALFEAGGEGFEAVGTVGLGCHGVGVFGEV